MFGLKIIKKVEYLTMMRSLEDAQVMLSDKSAKIASLEFEISHLNNKIAEMKRKEMKEEKTSDVILLTDIAESPLKVEKKPRVRKTTKSKVTKKEKDITK